MYIPRAPAVPLHVVPIHFCHPSIALQCSRSPLNGRSCEACPWRTVHSFESALASFASGRSIGCVGGEILREANQVRNSERQESSCLFSDLPSVSTGLNSTGHLLQFSDRVSPQARNQAIEEK